MARDFLIFSFHARPVCAAPRALCCVRAIRRDPPQQDGHLIPRYAGILPVWADARETDFIGSVTALVTRPDKFTSF